VRRRQRASNAMALSIAVSCLLVLALEREAGERRAIFVLVSSDLMRKGREFAIGR
jgi:hypothetical protein